MEHATIVREATELLGDMPGFLQALPQAELPRIWQAMHTLELSPGQIPARYQQLVMFAVAISNDCRYGTHWHGEVAKAYGALEGELTEVGQLVAHTTWLGHQLRRTRYELEHFRRDVRLVCGALSGATPSARHRVRPHAKSVPPR